MRHALRIAGGVVAVGLVAYAVIALSSDPSKSSTRKRGRAATEARDSDGEDDEGGRSKRTVRKPAPPSKRPTVDRAPVPTSPPVVDPNAAAVPARYDEAYDEFVAIVEEVEGMAARGEHLSQARFVEIYRKGDNLTVALMRTPEVMGSENLRSQLGKLNQRFRMNMSQVGPLPADP